MPISDQPTSDQPTSAEEVHGEMDETALRERQELLVRGLAVEQNTSRLQALSDELELIQRRLEQVRHP